MATDWSGARPPSSSTHGIPDTDMIHAFNHPIFVDEFEIGVVDTSDGPIIIHAMTARPKYLR
jgi:hypothetical protein